MSLSSKDREMIRESQAEISDLFIAISNKVEALNKFYAKVLQKDGEKKKDNN